MKLYTELILSMTLTGTLPFLAYLTAKKILGNKTSSSFQYHMLKFCLMCYLIPFSLIKSLISHAAAPRPAAKLNQYTDLTNTILQTDSGFRLRISGDFQKIFLVAWLSILVLLICFQLYRYYSFRYHAMHKLMPDEAHQKELKKQKDLMGVRRDVSLFYCDAPISPFTYGILHPCVVLTASVPESSVCLVLRHELQHIKSQDFLVRAAASLALLLHCFNPFLYLLWKELKEVQELTCDERLTARLSAEEIRNYGYLLVDIASVSGKKQRFAVPLTPNNKKFIQYRIQRLKAAGQPRSLMASIGFLILGLISFCFPVLACSPEILDVKNYPISDASTWFSLEEGAALSKPPADEMEHFKGCGLVILEDDSIIEYILPDKTTSCTHTWTDATFKDHAFDRMEGCYVLTYQVEYCPLCRTIKNPIPVSEIHYVSCPHQIK